MLAEALEVTARRAVTHAALLHEFHVQDLMQLNGYIHLDPKLKKALSTLAETQPFKEILPVSAKLARAKSAALNILVKPEPRDALADFTGSDHQFAIVRSNDRVVLYGTDGEEAIIFNERNNSVGRVPLNILGWVSPKADLQFETFTARENNNGDPSYGYFLSWKVGTRILVCGWENRKFYRGIGINLSTGKTGRFEIRSHNCVVDP